MTGSSSCTVGITRSARGLHEAPQEGDEGEIRGGWAAMELGDVTIRHFGHIHADHVMTAVGELTSHGRARGTTRSGHNDARHLEHPGFVRE